MNAESERPSVRGRKVGRGNEPLVIKVGVPEWMDEAKCNTMGPDGQDLDQAFPATVEESRRFIRYFCSRCPVTTECLAFAEGNNVQHGVWGGVLFGKDYLRGEQDGAA